MKINEIILVESADEDLRQEVLDTIGHPNRDPYYRSVDVNLVVQRAKPYYNKTKVTKGRAVHLAMQELYPELENGPKDNNSRNTKRNTGQSDVTKFNKGADTVMVTRSAGWNDTSHGHLRTTDPADDPIGIKTALKKAGDVAKSTIPGASELSGFADKLKRGFKKGQSSSMPSLKGKSNRTR